MSLLKRITIQTPESVELEFTLAGIGNRGVALVIDNILWGFILICLLVIWAILATQLQDYFNHIKSLQLWLTSIALLIVFIVYTCYFVLFETLWQGQTPGKRYAKIRVVRDNGQPVGLTQSLLRSLLRSIDDILFLGMLLIILGKREKRLGDWVAGTLVVQDGTPSSPQRLQVSDQAQSLATQLLGQVNIGALMPDDFAVVREYLQRRAKMEPRARATLARNLAEQASSLMGMDQLPIKLAPDIFLEAVYLAYQQQPNF